MPQYVRASGYEHGTIESCTESRGVLIADRHPDDLRTPILVRNRFGDWYHDPPDNRDKPAEKLEFKVTGDWKRFTPGARVYFDRKFNSGSGKFEGKNVEAFLRDADWYVVPWRRK